MTFSSPTEIEITFEEVPTREIDLISAMVDVDADGLPVQLELLGPAHTIQRQTGAPGSLPSAAELGADGAYYSYSADIDIAMVYFFLRAPRELPFHSHAVPIRGLLGRRNQLCGIRLRLTNQHADALAAYIRAAPDKELWSQHPPCLGPLT